MHEMMEMLYQLPQSVAGPTLSEEQAIWHPITKMQMLVRCDSDTKVSQIEGGVSTEDAEFLLCCAEVFQILQLPIAC